MKYQTLIRPAAGVLVAALATAGVFAQAPDDPVAPPGTGPAVMTDAAPPPAEDRSSPGAIVIDPRPPTAVMGNVGAPTQRVLDQHERDKLRDAQPAPSRDRTPTPRPQIVR